MRNKFSPGKSRLRSPWGQKASPSPSSRSSPRWRPSPPASPQTRSSWFRSQLRPRDDQESSRDSPSLTEDDASEPLVPALDLDRTVDVEDHSPETASVETREPVSSLVPAENEVAAAGGCEARHLRVESSLGTSLDGSLVENSTAANGSVTENTPLTTSNSLSRATSPHSTQRSHGRQGRGSARSGTRARAGASSVGPRAGAGAGTRAEVQAGSTGGRGQGRGLRTETGATRNAMRGAAARDRRVAQASSEGFGRSSQGAQRLGRGKTTRQKPVRGSNSSASLSTV